jgi:hypothetical protein
MHETNPPKAGGGTLNPKLTGTGGYTGKATKTNTNTKTSTTSTNTGGGNTNNAGPYKVGTVWAPAQDPLKQTFDSAQHKMVPIKDKNGNFMTTSGHLVKNGKYVAMS